MMEKTNDKNNYDELNKSKSNGHADGHGHNHDHGNNMVTIIVNNEEVLIHRGNQTVAAIKLAGKVPSTDILYLIPNYEVALIDTDTITIRGGECFKSSAPSGGSS